MTARLCHCREKTSQGAAPWKPSPGEGHNFVNVRDQSKTIDLASNADTRANEPEPEPEPEPEFIPGSIEGESQFLMGFTDESEASGSDDDPTQLLP
jgi:hypothetical protein